MLPSSSPGHSTHDSPTSLGTPFADAFISKKHSEAEPGLDSPGVGDYKLREELLDPKKGAHFGTGTKDLIASNTYIYIFMVNLYV